MMGKSMSFYHRGNMVITMDVLLSSNTPDLLPPAALQTSTTLASPRHSVCQQTSVAIQQGRWGEPRGFKQQTSRFTMEATYSFGFCMWLMIAFYLKLQTLGLWWRYDIFIAAIYIGKHKPAFKEHTRSFLATPHKKNRTVSIYLSIVMAIY